MYSLIQDIMTAFRRKAFVFQRHQEPELAVYVLVWVSKLSKCDSLMQNQHPGTYHTLWSERLMSLHLFW